MTLASRIRRYLGLALAVVVASALLLWNWDPFHRRRHAEERASASADAAASAALEAQGARESLVRTEAAVRKRDAAQRATASVQILAQQSKDAHEPLSSERAARLREHDLQLCLIDPTLSGCSAKD